MSVWIKTVSVIGAAAAMVMLGQGVAMADQPQSPWGAQQPVRDQNLGPTKVCSPKPTDPNYPLEPGSPSCCSKPDTWQQQFSGGLEGTPKKYYWVCTTIPTPPK